MTCLAIAPGLVTEQAKQGGRNSVSQLRLHYGTWHQDSRLPYVRTYCTRSLGPEIPAGACRRLLYCFERPESGLGRPEGAQTALKWSEITVRVLQGCQHGPQPQTKFINRQTKASTNQNKFSQPTKKISHLRKTFRSRKKF